MGSYLKLKIMKFQYLVILLLLQSCNSNYKNPIKKIETIEKGRKFQKEDSLQSGINNCIPLDTIIGNLGLIYINRDSIFKVKVMIDKYDSILPFEFNCSSPQILIPSLLSVNKNIICLKRGYGQEYREFILCYVEEGKLVIKKYEISLAVDLKNDIIVYQDYSNLDKIFIEDIKSSRNKIFNIPLNFHSKRVNQAIIQNGKIQIKFSDEQEIIIKEFF